MSDLSSDSFLEVVEGTKSCPADPCAVVVSIDHGRRDEGPGPRTLVRLKGCVLRCLWCASPETQALQPEVYLHAEFCQLSGACVTACTSGRHDVASGKHLVRPGVICGGCLACVEACDHDALEVVGRVRTVSEILAVLDRDPDLRSGRAGLSLGGGEPLMQAEFALALLAQAGERGWHRAIDTCGGVSPLLFAEALSQVDLVLFDLKETDPTLHQTWTRGQLQPILDNLEMAAESGVELWLRMPVIPFMNDRDEHWLAAIDIIQGLAGDPKVYLVPYVTGGDAKRRAMGVDEGALAGVGPPDPARVDEIDALFRRHGIAVRR